MPEFLNTDSTTGAINKIATNATKELVLISPYVKIPQNFLERLKCAGNKDIKITLVCREKDLKPEERENLRQINNLEIRFLENLHAKCFYNEESMVIGSLNLHEYSQQNNYEMGILLTLNDDHPAFMDALGEANHILSVAKTEIPDKKVKEQIISSKSLKEGLNSFKNKRQEKAETTPSAIEEIKNFFNKPISFGKSNGHCIRCGEDIPLNPDNPYCLSHYEKWKEYENPDYKEKYCHSCGKERQTSKKHPLCRTCYMKTQKN